MVWVRRYHAIVPYSNQPQLSPSAQYNTRNPSGASRAAQSFPFTNNAVDHTSVSNAEGASTETASVPFAGIPVRGSMMWL